MRQQTFNRSGFQQIQLDIQYLRTPLKEAAENEAAIDLLLDEVTLVKGCLCNLMKLYFLFSLSVKYVAAQVSVAAAERSLDPIPLEHPILDKLIQAKLAKTKEQNTVSS